MLDRVHSDFPLGLVNILVIMTTDGALTHRPNPNVASQADKVVDLEGRLMLTYLSYAKFFGKKEPVGNETARGGYGALKPQKGFLY